MPVEIKHFLMSRRGTGKNDIVKPAPFNIVIGNLSLALQAAAYEAAQLNPSLLSIQNTILPKDIFYRTPIERFE